MASQKVPPFSVGIGFDLHRLVEGRDLVLGGVTIPYPKGLLGHSDGDALLHALIDALLGAAGEGDIGTLFPDHDPRYDGISSLLLLEETAAFLQRKGRVLNNLDAVIVAEAPKMAPYVPEMKEKISRILSCPVEKISIKAKTHEGVGEIGRGEAISCYAVASLMEAER